MKTSSFYSFVLDIRKLINNEVEDKGVFNSFCVDVAYLHTLDKEKEYTLYFLFSESTTVMYRSFEEAVICQTKGFEGIYKIQKEGDMYTCAYFSGEKE